MFTAGFDGFWSCHPLDVNHSWFLSGSGVNNFGRDSMLRVGDPARDQSQRVNDDYFWKNFAHTLVNLLKLNSHGVKIDRWRECKRRMVGPGYTLRGLSNCLDNSQPTSPSDPLFALDLFMVVSQSCALMFSSTSKKETWLHPSGLGPPIGQNVPRAHVGPSKPTPPARQHSPRARQQHRRQQLIREFYLRGLRLTLKSREHNYPLRRFAIREKGWSFHAILAWA